MPDSPGSGYAFALGEPNGLVEARSGPVNAARGLAKAQGERLLQCDADSFNVERMKSLPSAAQQVWQPLLEEVASLTDKNSGL